MKRGVFSNFITNSEYVKVVHKLYHNLRFGVEIYNYESKLGIIDLI